MSLTMRTKYSIIILVLYLSLASRLVWTLRLKSAIIPALVERGQSFWLSCDYELQQSQSHNHNSFDDSRQNTNNNNENFIDNQSEDNKEDKTTNDVDNEWLYSVKWYKDGDEFYRLLVSSIGGSGSSSSSSSDASMPLPAGGANVLGVPPGSRASHAFFAQSGVQVSMRASNATHVRLTNASIDTEGTYACEISTQSLASVRIEKDLRVYVLPKGRPQINNLRTSYELDDAINVTCTTDFARPAPALVWYINEHPIYDSPEAGFWLSRWLEPDATRHAQNQGLTRASVSLYFKLSRRTLARLSTLNQRQSGTQNQTNLTSVSNNSRQQSSLTNSPMQLQLPESVHLRCMYKLASISDVTYGELLLSNADVNSHSSLAKSTHSSVQNTMSRNHKEVGNYDDRDEDEDQRGKSAKEGATCPMGVIGINENDPLLEARVMKVNSLRVHGQSSYSSGINNNNNDDNLEQSRQPKTKTKASGSLDDQSNSGNNEERESLDDNNARRQQQQSGQSDNNQLRRRWIHNTTGTTTASNIIKLKSTLWLTYDERRERVLPARVGAQLVARCTPLGRTHTTNNGVCPNDQLRRLTVVGQSIVTSGHHHQQQQHSHLQHNQRTLPLASAATLASHMHSNSSSRLAMADSQQHTEAPPYLEWFINNREASRQQLAHLTGENATTLAHQQTETWSDSWTIKPGLTDSQRNQPELNYALYFADINRATNEPYRQPVLELSLTLAKHHFETPDGLLHLRCSSTSGQVIHVDQQEVMLIAARTAQHRPLYTTTLIMAPSARPTSPSGANAQQRQDQVAPRRRLVIPDQQVSASTTSRQSRHGTSTNSASNSRSDAILMLSLVFFGFINCKCTTTTSFLYVIM